MSALQGKASQQAINWGQQRMEAIERAKKLREERKFNLAMTGEMAVGTLRLFCI